MVEQIPQAISQEIERLFTADQQDRSDGLFRTDPTTCVTRDTARREAATALLADVDLTTLSGEDLFRLAIIWQHGMDPHDYKKAQELAELASTKGYETAAWLAAAAEDRYRLATGKKQIWGTQFELTESGQTILSEMESDDQSGITDDMRYDRGVMTRTEILEYLESENAENN